MIAALTAGILLGGTAGLLPGPMLMLLITQTMRHSTREGLKVAAAPLLTDAPIVLGSWLVLMQMSGFHRVLGVLSIGGGLYVLYLAYESLQSGGVNLEMSQESPRSLQKAFLVNFLNPHPYLFWVSVGVPFMLKARESHVLAPVVFVFCFYVLLVGSKMVLALAVGKSRAFLTGRTYRFAMRLLACLLVLFAGFLFRDALVFLGVLQG